MGVLLILAQVTLLVLCYGAHVLNHVSLWLIWLPGILFVTLWVSALLMGGSFVINSFRTFGRR